MDNQIFGYDDFGVPTSGAVRYMPITGGNLSVEFIGCVLRNLPGAAPGEEAGSTIQVVNNAGNPARLKILGGQVVAGANTTDWIYVEPSVTGKVICGDVEFVGTPTNLKFNDASGNAVLRFHDSPGVNPLLVTTPAVSTPLTNTFGVDIYVSFIANAAGTTFTVNGKALGATPASAQGGFLWPVGSVMSYVGVPASWAFIGL
jgi:hypothetical protein